MGKGFLYDLSEKKQNKKLHKHCGHNYINVVDENTTFNSNLCHSGGTIFTFSLPKFSIIFSRQKYFLNHH